MPQMAPLWWETLFVMFIMLFLFLSTIIYFNKMTLPKNSNFNKINSQMNWKW
uniref:ATP synthase complex subunit 8 n=2 Tax=Chorosoma TaxID=1545297 RepID=A0A8T9ZY63_9HEMI|nr:ATP synthase F0 subunit 8 [Chorosoma macilentum]UPL65614.1 ATPase subunit 8 [Chorosoma sp.]